MKLAALIVLLLAATPPAPEARYFHYERPVTVAAAAAQGKACAPLDAGVFANASADLADLRLYRGETEVPYAIVTASAPTVASRALLPLNAGIRNGHTEFDAAMPAGTYADVELQIAKDNFQAKVEVSGSQTAAGSDARRIGTYTIFDLSNEKSGRNTVLHLPTSDFRTLHFSIDGPVKPEEVTGIVVLPAANVPEPPYTTVAQSTIATLQGHTTTMSFTVPAHVPIDRVLFQPGGEPVQFRRGVTVKVTPASPPRDEDDTPSYPMSFTGTLLRLDDRRDGQVSHEENFSVQTAGRRFDVPQTWTIAVDNGDDQPLQLGNVQLQMLRRELCFATAGAASYVLRYGDAALSPPSYDYTVTGQAQTDAVPATLGAERLNPAWTPRPDERAFTERHPLLLWGALASVILFLGWVALRSRPRHA